MLQTLWHLHDELGIVHVGVLLEPFAAIHLDDTLARDLDIEITLVNRENFVLFTAMLHEVQPAIST